MFIRKKPIIFQKDNSLNQNSQKEKNINLNPNQCLYKQDILSSLIRLPTKIKQNGVIKSYNIENIERQKNNYYSRAISIKQSKSNDDTNSVNNLNKIEIIINTLNDLFNQIQTLIMKGKKCVKVCNDWIKIFNNNADFIIEMTESHEYLPLINNAINLIFFTIILLYDISYQNKSQFFFEDIKSILNIYMLLTETIYNRCKNKNKINLKQQSVVISISIKDLNDNLNKLVSNYHQINSNLAKEFINLFKKLRRINTNDIYDFFQKLLYKNEDENFEIPVENKQKSYSHQDQIDLIKNSIQKVSNLNNYFYSININNKNRPYSHYTADQSLNSNSINSKIISPGNFIVTDINYVGAALTNSGVIFPFRKSNKMKIRSVSYNNNNKNNSYNNFNIKLTNKYYSHNTNPNINRNINQFKDKNIGFISYRLSEPNNFQNRDIISQNVPLIPFSSIKPYTLVIYLEENIVYIPKGTNNIYLRPFLKDFLQNISEFYELLVFSSGIRSYADQIIDFIEKEEKYFAYRLYRENANYYNKSYYLDINKLGRDIKRIVVIDNHFDYENNGILIESFIDENENIKNDKILIYLSEMLINIANEGYDDIREGLKIYKNEFIRYENK